MNGTRTFFKHAALTLLCAALFGGCGSADRREVYRGRNGEGVAAIVAEIRRAERNILVTAAVRPRKAVADALAAARARGVEVEFVVCGDTSSGSAAEPAPAEEAVPVRFDRTHPHRGGAVFVVDAKTVVRTSFSGRNDADEAVMVTRDSPDLGRRVAAECISHVERAKR